jgi:hypothetical protein
VRSSAAGTPVTANGAWLNGTAASCTAYTTVAATRKRSPRPTTTGRHAHPQPHHPRPTARWRNPRRRSFASRCAIPDRRRVHRPTASTGPFTHAIGPSPARAADREDTLGNAGDSGDRSSEKRPSATASHWLKTKPRSTITSQRQAAEPIPAGPRRQETHAHHATCQYRQGNGMCAALGIRPSRTSAA